MRYLKHLFQTIEKASYFIFDILLVLSCDRYLFQILEGLWLRTKDSKNIGRYFICIIDKNKGFSADFIEKIVVFVIIEYIGIIEEI